MLNHITKRQIASDNKSGTPLVHLYRKYGKQTATDTLKPLLKNKEVIIRPGINDTLIFLNK